MTGWRVGYLAAPAAILEGIVKVHQYGIMSAPTTAQDAALEALVGGEADVERMRAEYDRRRRLVVDGLNRDRAADVRAARRVLRLPRGDDGDRPDAPRRSPRGCSQEERVAVDPGLAPSDPAARATSGRATRRRTSSSRRPSSGSGGSWTATGPALAEARVIEPPTGAASPAPPPAMAPGSVPSGAAVRSAAPGRPRRSSSPTSRAAPGSGRSSRWRWPRRSPSTTPCCGPSSRAAAAPCSRPRATACSPCSTIPRRPSRPRSTASARCATRTGARPAASGSGWRSTPARPSSGTATTSARRSTARPGSSRIGHGGQILCSAMSAVLVGDAPAGRRRAARPGLPSAARPRPARAGVPGHGRRPAAATFRRSARSAPGGRTCPSS